MKRTSEDVDDSPPEMDIIVKEISESESEVIARKTKKQKKSKKKNKKRARQQVTPVEDEEYDQYEEAEDDDQLLMHTKTTLPPNLRKFWNRRYDLFSKFDEGIYMTTELWFSVTPESLARYTAELFNTLLPQAKTCLDICCGGGGNTIQFAEHFDSVGAIDINPTNVYCTEHNAEIYGVRNKIWTLQADWNEISQSTDWIPQDLKVEPISKTFDFIYSSPPWGGTNYNRDHFDLYTMEYFPIVQFLTQIKQFSENIALYLPRSSNLDQLSQATYEVFGDSEKCRVIYINSNGRSVALLALFGSAFTQNISELDDYEEEEQDQEEQVNVE
ncbi:Trimethylguanosine synthase [Spathaspora sp. JA1]|nr:Trimethylguanosine synthase [Spathaspora sp. JA1]